MHTEVFKGTTSAQSKSSPTGPSLQNTARGMHTHRDAQCSRPLTFDVTRRHRAAVAAARKNGSTRWLFTSPDWWYTAPGVSGALCVQVHVQGSAGGCDVLVSHKLQG